MKRFLWLYIFLLPSLLFSQQVKRGLGAKELFWDKVSGEWGMEFTVWDIRRVYPDVSLFGQAPSLGGLYIGGRYNYLSYNDFVGVNIGAALQGGLRFGIPLNYYVGVPVYVMGNIGAGSSPYNESNFGGGIGIGARVNYLQLVYSNSVGQILRTSPLYALPFAVGEVTVSSYTFRLYYDLMKFPFKFQYSAGTQIDATINTLQFVMLFRF